MLIRWTHVAVAFTGLAAAAALIAWLGLISVRASTGHWAVTDRALHWVMRSSVRTAAMGKEVPPLDNANMLPVAAGHFETGCAGCHGSPAMPRPASVRGMLPPPPDLNEVVATWTDAQLFEIVRHGIRYAGMPAWPAAGRDDEVWALVAFLRRYSSLDAAAYRQLAGFAATQSRDAGAVLQTCNGCHAAGRLNPKSLIPRIDGQSETYMVDSLRAYASGGRQSGVMQAASGGLTEDLQRQLAAHFAGLAPALPETAPSHVVAEGRLLAENGNAGRRIPACLTCHDRPGGNPAYPTLSGQSADYLAGQLRLFIGGDRGGGPFRDIMHKAADAVTEADIQPLAEYFAQRPPSR